VDICLSFDIRGRAFVGCRTAIPGLGTWCQFTYRVRMCVGSGCAPETGQSLGHGHAYLRDVVAGGGQVAAARLVGGSGRGRGHPQAARNAPTCSGAQVTGRPSGACSTIRRVPELNSRVSMSQSMAPPSLSCRGCGGAGPGRGRSPAPPRVAGRAGGHGARASAAPWGRRRGPPGRHTVPCGPYDRRYL